MSQANDERTAPRRDHRRRHGDPARQRPGESSWAEPRRRRVRRGADHAVRHGRLRGPVRLRAEGLRADDVDRAEAGPADGPVLADGALRGSHGRGRQRDRHRLRARPGRSCRCDRNRRPRRVRGLLPEPARARSRPDEPVFDHPDHPEHGGGLGVDGARDAGTARDGDDGVRGVEHGDRRRARRDPTRPRRGDALRRHRGAGDAGRHRRLQRDARALAAKRRSQARLTAIRRRSRRVRHGRGRRDARSRGARSRASARGEDLRGAARLRRVLRRDSRHRARSLGRESGAGNADGVRRRGHHPGPGRVT